MLNQIALVGRLTRDPETLKTHSGSLITKFALAFNQGKNTDETEDTGFIEVTTFDPLAKPCAEWLSKGDKVAITGRIHQKKFVRTDGSKGSSIEVIASGVEFIDIIKQGEAEQEVEIPFEADPEVKVEAPKPVAKPTRNRR